MPLIDASATRTQGVVNEVFRLIEQYGLPIKLSVMAFADEPIAKQLQQQKPTQKYYRQLSHTYNTPIFIVDDKGQLSLLIDGIRVAPEWSKLQRRIVRAGRKSELLLQAAKLAGGEQVLDATAGFGHDSLILASTGASVTLLEQHPLLVLLLLVEQAQMSQYKNWQKLMTRLHIKWEQAEAYLIPAQLKQPKFDVIYLDPMFPDNSYQDTKTGKGAKVGKHMQALHGLLTPPSRQDEARLFDLAKQALSAHIDGRKKHKAIVINDLNNCNNYSDLNNQEGVQSRLIVKRPVNAPHLAKQTPDAQWQNEVLRFDGYFF